MEEFPRCAWRRVQVMGVTLLLLDDGMMMLALCVCVGEEVCPVDFRLFLIHPLAAVVHNGIPFGLNQTL